jgi:hypothetical protein
MPTLAFRVSELIVGQDETHTNIAAPRVVWEKETVNISADDAVRAANGNAGGKKERGAQYDVQKFLRETLAGGKPVPAKEIFEEGKRCGFSERQLTRGRYNMKAKTFQTPEGWSWQLGEGEPHWTWGTPETEPDA